MTHGEHEKAAKTVHTPEPVFLLDGARFKLSFNEVCCEECGTENDRVTVEPLGMYANDLQGRWVALVPAEDDKHLDLLHIKKQRDELLAALEPLRLKFRSGNCIPVERNVITAKEWATVEEAIASVRGSIA